LDCNAVYFDCSSQFFFIREIIRLPSFAIKIQRNSPLLNQISGEAAQRVRFFSSLTRIKSPTVFILACHDAILFPSLGLNLSESAFVQYPTSGFLDVADRISGHVQYSSPKKIGRPGSGSELNCIHNH